MTTNTINFDDLLHLSYTSKKGNRIYNNVLKLHYEESYLNQPTMLVWRMCCDFERLLDIEQPDEVIMYANWRYIETTFPQLIACGMIENLGGFETSINELTEIDPDVLPIAEKFFLRLREMLATNDPIMDHPTYEAVKTELNIAYATEAINEVKRILNVGDRKVEDRLPLFFVDKLLAELNQLDLLKLGLKETIPGKELYINPLDRFVRYGVFGKLTTLFYEDDPEVVWGEIVDLYVPYCPHINQLTLF